jgi:hypothetical protein
MEIGGAARFFHGTITREDWIILLKMARIMREEYLI